MEQLDKDLTGKLKLLKFTFDKTAEIVNKANIIAIERQREALIKITANIEEIKLQILEGKFERGDDDEAITNWSKNIEKQVEQVDAEVEKLQKYLNEMKANEASKTKEAERAKQLQFEKEQYEQKLQFEHKVEEIKKDKATKKSNTDQIQTKLPKLVITPFNGAPTDWLRFWNVFEAEIDNNSELPAVTKFAYLKELLKPNVRSTIDGLPFSTEGYTRAKNILKNKYGNTTEIVNAYVQNIMALPVISGTQPWKIHDFYEKLLFNVQALETLGKLTEINGYVRMSIDKLEGIRGDLLRTDEKWREWDFPKFVDALRMWTERNPRLPRKKRSEFQSGSSYNTTQRTCVYCDKPDHKSVECSSVTKPGERRQILQRKRLCFNCTGSGHRASECKSRSKCRVCDGKHHSSICEKPTRENLMTTNEGNEQQVVYPVVVVDVHGVKCRALLDSGSGSSYASAVLLKTIGVEPISSEMRQIEMMLSITTRRMDIYNINVSSLNKTFAMDINVSKVEKPQLMTMKNPGYKSLLERYPHLEGVVMDDMDDKTNLPVHLILGISECTRVSTAEPPRIGGEWDPVATLTRLGWTITSPGQEFDVSAMLLTQTARVDYEELCKLDVLGLTDHPAGDQSEVFEEFKEQLQRSQDGWYQTGLPWKGDHLPLPTGKDVSLRRLNTLVRKLEKSGTIKDYDKIIKEQLDQGVIERAPDTVVGKECYIPHKPVIREKAESTKLRIVYDASARVQDNAPSLNECLNPGPPLQNQLWSVLVRGRFNPVALTADIKQAFLQVRICQEDRDALRFHWLKDVNSKEVEIFRFTRALFGLAPSPFLLGGVIKQHLEEWRSKSPKTVCEIEKSLYVDDLISGATTTDEAKLLKVEATEIFEDGAFQLHKWHSNVATLESNQHEGELADETFAKQQLRQPESGNCSLLGLAWNKNEDTISVTIWNEDVSATKRGVLTKVAKIYDPLGLASPLSLTGKMLYREACNLKCGWDQSLPIDLMKRWQRWERELPECITTVRSLAKYQEPVTSINLHAFGDASGNGVAASIYAVVSQPSGQTQGLVTAKARLAKQGLTIPRQELVAGHMAANLVTNVKEALEGFPVANPFCWLDSTVALHWIRGEGSYKQFVQNRVNKIQQKNLEWRYVPTRENPADLGSRGGAVTQNNDLWWNGPKWLSKPEDWPTNVTTKATKESLVEAKKVRELFQLAIEQEPDEFSELIERRNYWTVIRTCVWVARFVHNTRNKDRKKSGPLTTEEIEAQKKFWEERAQRQGEVSEKYEADRMQLNLQRNQSGLLECRGRVQGHYPIYLPDTEIYTEKFVQQAHEETLHGGVGLTMAKVREKHWVPRLRQLAKRLIKKCPGCKRFQTTALASPPPGLLPKDRTEGNTSFQVVGVDYAGPLKIRVKQKQEGKAYVILYACSLTRALHLELAKSMEMEEFLLSFKSFIARRGRPEKVYSDNGRTFVGVASWIKKVRSSEKFNDFLAHQGITWQFNLSKAPWWGGQFERMVGLVKGALRKSIGKSLLTFVELKEVLLDIEVALNNRPLSYVEDDIQMPLITPESMMRPQSNLLPELEPHLEETVPLRKRAKYLKRCKDTMWKRWTNEYLRGLRERHNLKHKRSSEIVKKGEVVIIKGDEKDRNQWKLGIVEKVLPGKDGVIRAVRLRAGRNELERPIQHLYPLELSCDVERDTKVKLNPETPAFRPRRNAAEVAKARISDIAEDENND